MPDIRVEDLTKRWGETVAVDRISFTIADGAFAVLLGPSGCGKSTTLRLIAGLSMPSGGELTTDDERSSDSQGAAFVFQDANLLPWRTVADNIRFLRRNRPI